MAREPREREEESETAQGAGIVMVPTPNDQGTAEDEVVAKIEPTPKETEERQHDQEEDSRLAYDLGDDDEIAERESRRSRRTRAKRDAETAASAQIGALNSKIEHLEKTIGSLTQGQIGITLHTIDAQIGAAQAALDACNGQLEKAINESDGARGRQVLTMRDEAIGRLYQLSGHKQRLTNDARFQEQRGGSPGQPQGTPPRVAEPDDSRTQEYLDRFMERFSYFDSKGADADSQIMKAIDDTVHADGYLPKTKLYWTTLEARLAARGYHPEGKRDTEDQDDAPRRSNGGRPPSSSGRGSSGGRAPSFHLEPMMREYLDGENLLDSANLSADDKARRDRLIRGWQDNQRKAKAGTLGKG